MRRINSIGALVLVLFAMTGCAGPAAIAPGGKPPTIAKVDNVHIVHDTRSAWKLPVNTYRVPDTSVFVFDMEKSDGSASRFLGPLGVLVSMQASSSGIASSVSDAGKIGNIDELMNGVLVARLGATSSLIFVAPAESIRNAYEVAPYVWISKNKEGKTSATVASEIKWHDASGNVIWRKYYTAPATEERPVNGENGWLNADNVNLDALMKSGVERIATAFLQDAATE